MSSEAVGWAPPTSGEIVEVDTAHQREGAVERERRNLKKRVSSEMESMHDVVNAY